MCPGPGYTPVYPSTGPGRKCETVETSTTWSAFLSIPDTSNHCLFHNRTNIWMKAKDIWQRGNGFVIRSTVYVHCAINIIFLPGVPDLILPSFISPWLNGTTLNMTAPRRVCFRGSLWIQLLGTVVCQVFFCKAHPWQCNNLEKLIFRT